MLVNPNVACRSNNGGKATRCTIPQTVKVELYDKEGNYLKEISASEDLPLRIGYTNDGKVIFDDGAAPDSEVEQWYYLEYSDRARTVVFSMFGAGYANMVDIIAGDPVPCGASTAFWGQQVVKY